MRNKLSFLFLIIFLNFKFLQAQTYQLSGNPVNITGWSLVSNAIINTDFIQLTADQTGLYGAIKLNDQINLKYCDKWKVEFDFRIDGNGTVTYGRGDGFTFWYLVNPPTGFVSGGGLGIPANASGLMVGFDIFNNTTEAQMSKIHILYGTNNGTNNNIEFNNTPGSTFHSPDLNPTQPFVGANYKHVIVNGEVDPNNPNNWIIKILLDNVQIVNQSFAPSGGAIGMTQGYFGFSAATGGASARHSIKNVKIYVDKVPIFQNTITPNVCINPTTGTGNTNLTQYENQFVANPANYTFTYFVQGSTVPIANPSNFQFTGNTNVQVVIKDPTATLCDNGDGIIVIQPTPFVANNATLTACSNNNSGFATYNLTQANVINDPTVTKKYFSTLANLNAGIEIPNPFVYTAPQSDVYILVTSATGCTAVAKVTLQFYPNAVVNDQTLKTCFLENITTNGIFNLTQANVSATPGIVKQYYPSPTDAINGTNEILNPTNYNAPSGFVFVKVSTNQGCYNIAKITLKVEIPQPSSLLKDVIICTEKTTTLDAGPGYLKYEWSTGATTSSITNVGVGDYWVKLTKDGCTTKQTVKVIPAAIPTITNVEVSNNNATIMVNGGKPPYQYSNDSINWQDSNIFIGIPRGQFLIFVKDQNNCSPIMTTVTNPYLINIITPNDDGQNDTIDYSALGYKTDFTMTIYDRYGVAIHEANKKNNYTWNGKLGGRKLPTATYWYTITWKENDPKQTPVKFSGWILLKNRD